MMFSAWGKNASFTFDAYDDYFMKTRNMLGRAEMAFCRIQYPEGLNTVHRANYEAYLERCMYIERSAKRNAELIGNEDAVTAVLDFIYDSQGRPFALNYSTDGGVSFNTYYYVLNLQGDVVKLVQILSSSTGIQEYSEVANYAYDAWGNIISSSGTMADLNPLRYRGYYYDSETGFYYLQSRYYDPANHRFINADSYKSTGQGFVGTNMFAYCNNNPANYEDPSGKFLWIIVPGFFIFTIAVLSGCESEEKANWPQDCPYKYKESGSSRTDDNCYSYAFDYHGVCDPGDASGVRPYVEDAESGKREFALNAMRDAVEADGRARNRNITYLPEEYLAFSRPEGAYLIACKLTDDRQNYHFAIQLPNGDWIDKPGTWESRYNQIDGFAAVWVIGEYTYNSETIFFLYTP